MGQSWLPEVPFEVLNAGGVGALLARATNCVLTAGLSRTLGPETSMLWCSGNCEEGRVHPHPLACPQTLGGPPSEGWLVGIVLGQSESGKFEPVTLP